jgi:hypothetical protein
MHYTSSINKTNFETHPLKCPSKEFVYKKLLAPTSSFYPTPDTPRKELKLHKNGNRGFK